MTQDDMAADAASDVTAALRRTQMLMQQELSRSQFAQETLGMPSCSGWSLLVLEGKSFVVA